MCNTTIQVDIEPGPLDLSREQILTWVQKSAASVATYYGRFPVAHTTVSIVPVPDKRGVLSGRTWGSPSVHHRIRLGQHTTAGDLNDDWMMTHELVHTAFPDLDDSHHWIEEGLAVYVEPIARVQHGVLPQAQVWSDMIRDMSKGEPQPEDRGLDHTQTWASTYWGGALFFLQADVTIRERTGNRKGLQDALRAMVATKTIESNANPEEMFRIGDRAVGVTVLENMYLEMSHKPVAIDLNGLWKKLGVEVTPSGAIHYDDNAPDAAIRKAIFLPRDSCAAGASAPIE